MGHRLTPLPLLISLLLLSACGSAFDASTGRGKDAIIDEVNLALGKNDCTKAISLIDKVYDSANTDNRVRLIRASAYACKSNFNFFKLVGDLQTNTSKISSNELWQLMTQWFPSVATDLQDRVLESAQGATDALLASIKPGQVLIPGALFYPTSYNPQTGSYTDRTGESNIYLTFVSMATIGAYHNRFGNPNPTTFKKGNALTWDTAVKMQGDGCGYASALVYFADALGGTQLAAHGALADTLKSVKDAFQRVIYASCDVGCQNIIGFETNGAPIAAWKQSGCTVVGANCSSCPALLRDRSSCTGAANNLPSCAAAGIVNFMNTHSLGWQ